MGSFILTLLLLGAFAEISQSANCHAQCDYDHVTDTANCSNRNLACIPDNYPDALIVDLSCNNITQIDPDDFQGNFTKVVELILDYNNITDVEPILMSSAMDRLQRLSVRHNSIAQLDESCQLSSLRVFLIDYNMLTFLDHFTDCSDLQKFSATFNQISYLASGIFLRQTSILSHVDLRFNLLNNLNVRYIYHSDFFPNNFLVDNNNISDVSIHRQRNSIPGVFSISHNNLQSLQMYIAPTVLNLSSNGLHGLNTISIRRPNPLYMQILDITNNSMDALIQPDWAEGLRVLYANDNILANLSSTTLQGFINLTELHLTNNRLQFISPCALSQLTSLETLLIDGNVLTSLLGGIFHNQSVLLELSVTNNILPVLHPTDFIGLVSLERLYLAGNRLVQIHSQIFQHIPEIVTIDLSQNELASVDLGHCYLGRLQNISLTNNSLRDVSGVLGHCSQLQFLDLSFNHIQVISKDSIIGGNEALVRMEIEGNQLQCDCRMAVLRDWLLSNPPSILPRCHGPTRHAGVTLTDLDTHDFTCQSPMAKADANSPDVFLGQTATLSCTATGIPAPVISWLDPNGTTISGDGENRILVSQGKTLHVIVVHARRLDQGSYTCQANNVLGETARDVINLTISENSDKPVSHGISFAACVFPWVLIGLFATLLVVAIVIMLCRRYK